MCDIEVFNDLYGSYCYCDGSIWIYDSEGEFVADFKVNFCPICGAKA